MRKEFDETSRSFFFVWIENNNGRQFIRTTTQTTFRFANIARGKKKNGNYIRVDTTTSDDKNYLNQQPKQLVSTTFRGPTPSAARKKIN